MPAKNPVEMSSWERRKLYSKNLNPSNSVTNASKGDVKKLQSNFPARSVLTKIEENTKMTSATSSSKLTSKGKATLAVLPSKAAPSVVTARRATIAVTNRPSLAIDRRLTIAASKPASKRVTMGGEKPIKNANPVEANTSRKRYYDVAPRIFTGIKKTRLDNIRLASSAPSKIFTKPPIAVKSTRPVSNARRSLYGSARLSAAPEDLKKVVPLPDQSKPNSESNIKKRKADPLKPKDVKKSRPMAEKTVAATTTKSTSSKTSMSQPSTKVGSKRLSAKTKLDQPIAGKKDVELERAILDTVVSVSIDKVPTASESPIATVLPDDNLGNTPRPVRKGTPHRVRCSSYTISKDDHDFPGLGGASIIPLDNAGHTPRPIRRGSFTISTDNETKEETNVAYVSPMKKHSDTFKIEHKGLCQTNKTPAKSALKKSVRLSKGQFDSENLPPLETLDASLVVAATPIPKRSKSVSFKVASNGKNTPRTLPKTPRRDLSLRQKLELFMEEKGYSVSKHRHLHCFGYQLSDLKKQDRRTSKTPVQSSALSSPNLKERTPKKTLVPIQPMSPAQRPTDSKVDSILNDLKTLLIMGQPVEHGEEWLSELETLVLEKLEGNAHYWLVKALLAERAGRFQDAWMIFSEAVDRDAQPSEELVSALNEFAARVPPARCEVPAIPDATSEGIPLEAECRKTTPSSAKRQSRRSQRGTSGKSSAKKFQDTFESTVIKYTMQNSSTLQKLNKVLNLGTPTVATLLTPVRRSARLLRSEPSAGKRRSFNADDLPAPLREMFLNDRSDGV